MIEVNINYDRKRDATEREMDFLVLGLHDKNSKLNSSYKQDLFEPRLLNIIHEYLGKNQIQIQIEHRQFEKKQFNLGVKPRNLDIKVWNDVAYGYAPFDHVQHMKYEILHSM